jgi:hypothetical protein
MFPIRKLLIALGFVAVPTAVALAATAGAGDCCRPKSACCTDSAPCCKQVEAKQIVCPLTGETIAEDECPLCKGQK